MISHSIRLRGWDSDKIERNVLVDEDGVLLFREADPLTIHNYFPDGAVSDDALIDTDNESAPAKLWRAWQGTETLSLGLAAHGGNPNSVQVFCPGDVADEGVQVADWTGYYGDFLPIGLYALGVTLDWDNVSGLVDLRVRAVDEAGAAVYSPSVFLRLNQEQPRRVVVPIRTMAIGYVSLDITTNDAMLGADYDLQEVIFYAYGLTITEGDATAFRDGDSDGWSWVDTPHASASRGPKP